MQIEKYFHELEKEIQKNYSVAELAKSKGFDPVNKVEIPLAHNLAEKVIGLISSLYPQINDPKIVKRIIELEKEYGSLDASVSLKIAEEIAKEKPGFKPENSRPYYLLLPLHELIALHFGMAMNSKSVWSRYNGLIDIFDTEFNILLRISKEEMIKRKVDEKLIELILLNREGKLKIKPGYDGEYGVVQLPEKQAKLF